MTPVPDTLSAQKAAPVPEVKQKLFLTKKTPPPYIPVNRNAYTDEKQYLMAEEANYKEYLAQWEGYLAAGGSVNLLLSNGDTPLAHSVKAGHISLCQFFLGKGSNINSRNKDGKSILIECATYNPEMCEFLLKNGADLKITDLQGNTALHFAMYYKDDKIIRLLLKYGADVTTKNKSDETALSYGIKHEPCNLENIKTIINAGADVNQADKNNLTPFHHALRTGRTDLAKLLLHHGANLTAGQINGKSPAMAVASLWDIDLMKMLFDKNFIDIQEKDFNQSTLLFHAATEGDLGMCKLLLEKGVDINAKNAAGRTAVYCALEKKHIEVVRFLVKHGATLEDPGTDKLKNRDPLPLSLAFQTGNFELCKFLVLHGATFFDDPSTMRERLLTLAIQSKNPDILQYILNFNPDVNVKSHSYLRTPLHYAANTQNYDFCVFLISKGADINACTSNYETPLMISRSSSLATLRINLLLLEAGADLSQRNMAGQDFMDILFLQKPTSFISKHFQLKTKRYENAESPDSILLAAYEGDLERIKRYQENGRNIHIKDKHNETPLHFAIHGNQKEMCKWLLEHGADIHAPGILKGTPLHYAAALGHTEIMELLLEKGAQIEATSDYQKMPTPLAWATDAQQGKAVVMLVKHGASIKITTKSCPAYSAFITALAAGKESYCQFFRDNGFDFNKNMTQTTFATEFPPTFITSFTAFLNLERLLKHGFNINQQDKFGQTILHHVISRGKHELIPFILLHGGDPTIQDKTGISPLDMPALPFKYKTCIQRLIKEREMWLKESE
ncbi:MAG: ankyrin repeat domain-containing protein [Planctomycetia bacterium]|nr:ankyrin repeat domain-containing protein [Planctomycetia bacterium]